MAVKIVEHSDVGTVHLYKRRHSKTISLRFSGDKIRVTLPYWMPYKGALLFVTQKRQWISDNRPKMSSPILPQYRVGKYHQVRFIPYEKSKPRTLVKLTEVLVYHPANTSHLSSDIQTLAKKACIRALKKQADQLLPKRIEDLAKKHNFSYRSTHCKPLRSRWGSCDHNNAIILNIYLMQLPWHLIDYVLLHELSHTEHHNHGNDFWIRLQNTLPNAKLLRKELKSHQPELATN